MFSFIWQYKGLFCIVLLGGYISLLLYQRNALENDLNTLKNDFLIAVETNKNLNATIESLKKQYEINLNAIKETNEAKRLLNENLQNIKGDVEKSNNNVVDTFNNTIKRLWG